MREFVFVSHRKGEFSFTPTGQQMQQHQQTFMGQQLGTTLPSGYSAGGGGPASSHSALLLALQQQHQDLQLQQQQEQQQQQEHHQQQQQEQPQPPIHEQLQQPVLSGMTATNKVSAYNSSSDSEDDSDESIEAV
jgi:hypothetical protein